MNLMLYPSVAAVFLPKACTVGDTSMDSVGHLEEGPADRHTCVCRCILRGYLSLEKINTNVSQTVFLVYAFDFSGYSAASIQCVLQASFSESLGWLSLLPDNFKEGLCLQRAFLSFLLSGV